MKFEVVILSYNRPDYLRECLVSWLSQDLSETEIVVSDNSSTDDVWRMLETEFPQVARRRMNPHLSSVDHFNYCRTQARGDWYILFHDDDVLLPGAWESLRASALKHSHALAVAGNAFFVREKLQTKELFNPNLSPDQVQLIQSGIELFVNYCSPVTTHQPFPAYLYKRVLVQPEIFEVESAGKYSDATYLIRLAELGDIIWLGLPIMGYRVHGKNDSSVHSIIDGLKLLIFARKILRDGARSSKKTESEKVAYASRLELFRNWQLLLHLRHLKRQGQLSRHPWRTGVIRKQVIRYFMTHPAELIRKTINIIIRKI